MTASRLEGGQKDREAGLSVNKPTLHGHINAADVASDKRQAAVLIIIVYSPKLIVVVLLVLCRRLHGGPILGSSLGLATRAQQEGRRRGRPHQLLRVRLLLAGLRLTRVQDVHGERPHRAPQLLLVVAGNLTCCHRGGGRHAERVLLAGSGVAHPGLHHRGRTADQRGPLSGQAVEKASLFWVCLSLVSLFAKQV